MDSGSASAAAKVCDARGAEASPDRTTIPFPRIAPSAPAPANLELSHLSPIVRPAGFASAILEFIYQLE